MRQIRGVFWTLRCLHQPCVWRHTSTQSACGYTVAVGPRTAMYGALKPVPTSYNDAFCTHARGSTATLPYAHVRQCTALSRRTSTQHAADAKIICYHNLLQRSAQIELLYSMLHPSTYEDAMCVNVLDYDIAVCQGTVPGAQLA